MLNLDFLKPLICDFSLLRRLLNQFLSLLLVLIGKVQNRLVWLVILADARVYSVLGVFVIYLGGFYLYHVLELLGLESAGTGLFGLDRSYLLLNLRLDGSTSDNGHTVFFQILL